MDMQTAIRTVADGRDLDAGSMTAVMRTIMTGEATESQIGGFLIGLRMKGETVEEIAAAARVMRGLAASVPVAPEGLVDTAGTGGDVHHRRPHRGRRRGADREARQPVRIEPLRQRGRAPERRGQHSTSRRSR